MLKEFWTQKDKVFLRSSNEERTYFDLSKDLDACIKTKGALVLEAENSYQHFVRFLSLMERGHIVHMVPSFQFKDPAYRDLIRKETQTDFIFWGKDSESPEENGTGISSHPALKEAQENNLSRFIVRTSGSSGKKFKFVLHDPSLFVKKYLDRGIHFEKTIAFSPAETIAGIETLLEAVVHSRELVVGSNRPSPGEVVKLLSTFEVDFFQTTPSFMNLMSASGQLDPVSLKVLKKIAYGSEPSQKTVLEHIKKSLPSLEFMHTYGMSEIGIQKNHN